MQFGLYADRSYMTWDRLATTWVEADQIAVFESAWTWDHLYVYDETIDLRDSRARFSGLKARLRALRQPSQVDGVGPCLDGWMSLAGLLQATKRLRGGCLVTGMVYRHPAVLAKMATTVDILSGGRLELGLGAGWSERENAAYGLGIGDRTERADRFDEGTACLVSLMTQETTTFRGRYYRLEDARCDPKPLQQPHPPICIGGAGERRTIPSVARWAQRWHAGFDVGALPRKLDSLAKCCAEVGRDPADITVMMIADWDGQSAQQLTDHVGLLAERGIDMVLIRLADNDPRLVEPAAGALEGFAEPTPADEGRPERVRPLGPTAAAGSSAARGRR